MVFINKRYAFKKLFFLVAASGLFFNVYASERSSVSEDYPYYYGEENKKVTNLGCRWSKTLNIAYKDEKNGIDFITGVKNQIPQKKVYWVHAEEFTNGSKYKPPLNESEAKDIFDIDALHQVLLESEKNVSFNAKGRKNVVVVAFSMIFAVQKSNSSAKCYEAYSTFYTEKWKGSTLAFISGSSSSKVSLPKNNKKDMYKLITVGSISKEKEVFDDKKELFANFKDRFYKQEESKEEEAGGSVIDYSIAKDFLKKWETDISDIAQFNVEKPLEIASLEDMLDKKARKIKNCYGSTTDSEQVLLLYASRNKNQTTKLLDRLIDSYLTYRSQVNTNESECKKEKYDLISIIIHIHSTKEICQTCATSLAEEIYNKNNPFPLKSRLKGFSLKPFYAVSFSCSLALEPDTQENSNEKMHPEGISPFSMHIPRIKLLGNEENLVLNLNEVLREKWFPQSYRLLTTMEKRRIEQKDERNRNKNKNKNRKNSKENRNLIQESAKTNSATNVVQYSDFLEVVYKQNLVFKKLAELKQKINNFNSTNNIKLVLKNIEH